MAISNFLAPEPLGESFLFEGFLWEGLWRSAGSPYGAYGLKDKTLNVRNPRWQATSSCLLIWCLHSIIHLLPKPLIEIRIPYF